MWKIELVEVGDCTEKCMLQPRLTNNMPQIMKYYTNNINELRKI